MPTAVRAGLRLSFAYPPSAKRGATGETLLHGLKNIDRTVVTLNIGGVYEDGDQKSAGVGHSLYAACGFRTAIVPVAADRDVGIGPVSALMMHQASNMVGRASKLIAAATSTQDVIKAVDHPVRMVVCVCRQFGIAPPCVSKSFYKAVSDCPFTSEAITISLASTSTADGEVWSCLCTRHFGLRFSEHSGWFWAAAAALCWLPRFLHWASAFWVWLLPSG
jgi:hypothetical protein